MFLTLQNQLQVALILGTGEFAQTLPLDPAFYTHISIVQNTKYLLPTLDVGLFDVLGICQKSGAFLDGGQITVLMGPGDGEGPISATTFRIFTVEMSQTHKGMHLQISAYLDYPQYFRQQVKQSYKGTTSSVIAQIAGQCGLPPDTHQTNDEQVWLPNNKTMGQYCRFLCDRGWAGAGSCMMLAVTQAGGANWMLRYHNVMQDMNNNGSITFVNHEMTNGNRLHIAQHGVSLFGLPNNMYGYGADVGQHLLKGDFNLFDKVDFSMVTDSLQMNSVVKGLVGTVSKGFLPIDMGNMHKNYASAITQNNRMRSLFSTVVRVLTENLTNLAIFDSANVELMNFQTFDTDVIYNGRYVVTGRTQHIMGTDYKEMITLSSPGIGGDTSNSNMVS